MGFRQFHDFNLALLAKLSWRIITSPDSLWVRVLKSRYFPNSNFMTARQGASPSCIWNSILASRHLIDKGMLSQIGNGVDTSIWRDNWIPTLPNFALNPPLHHQHLTVDTLIDWNRHAWNLTPILPYISSHEATAIQAIPLISQVLSDKFVWPMEKNGIYSDRSAYHLQRSLHPFVAHAPQSSHQISHSVWNWVWHLSSLPKIKNFLW